MLIVILLISLFLISIDVFISSTVVGFLLNRLDLKALFRLQMVLGLFCGSLFFIGLVIGKAGFVYFNQWATWYASTIVFLLALKLLYDGIRLHKLKQSINPLDKKGLIAIASMVSINSIFVGMAFGLLSLEYVFAWYAPFMYLLAITLGFFAGFKMKKLITMRVGVFSAFIFFIIAILITVKF